MVVSPDGADSDQVAQLKRENLELRIHNLRLLDHLEATKKVFEGSDFVVFIQGKKVGDS